MNRRFLPASIDGRRWAAVITLSSGLLLTLPACSREAESAAAAPAPQALPVDVLTVTPRPLELTRELPGRTSASQVAEVRARINGIVLQRHFTEGADVAAGQLLFEIDPAPYAAALDSAQANLARAEANLSSAEVQADRLTGLVDSHAISQQVHDDAVARKLAARADVAAARAAVRSAEINLGYTRVTAPISGRIGRAEVTVGAYVQQATATLLAVVQQLDPLYIDLNQSVEEVLDLQEAIASGSLQGTDGNRIAITVFRNNGNPHPETGSLEFSDVSVNPSTGMVTLRGLVPNPGLRLLPGMFVRARLAEGILPAAILVPQSVVSRNARGDALVMMVGAEGTVEARPLHIDRAVGNQWLVSDGLQSGDRVISNQLQKIRPGVPVQVAATHETTAAN